MSSANAAALTSALNHVYQEDVRVLQRTPVASHGHAWALYLDNGERVFMKETPNAPKDIFLRELQGLQLLRPGGHLRVPRALYADERFILTEYLDLGPRPSNWQERFGWGLALLHKASRNKRFGLPHDNYLGLTPQPNDWHGDWLSFWRTRRFEWQLFLWQQRAPAGDKLLRLAEQLSERLDLYLRDVREEAVLLHGDLWAGNAGADAEGKPVVFDPAVYYGHREAEFGMMRLFGGFGERVEAAYQEVWPWKPGHEERITLYRLYHELNHLNLFGGAYYEQCVETIRSLL